MSLIVLQEDLKLLSHVVSLVQKFAKYSPNVQLELGRALHLESFPQSRVLLQQGMFKRLAATIPFRAGDPGTSFYYILSGAVYVMLRDRDPETHKPVARIPSYVSAS